MKTVEFENGILQPMAFNIYDVHIGKETPWGKVYKIHDTLFHKTINHMGNKVIAVELGSSMDSKVNRTAYFSVDPAVYKVVDETLREIVMYDQYNKMDEELIPKIFGCRLIKVVYDTDILIEDKNTPLLIYPELDTKLKCLRCEEILQTNICKHCGQIINAESYNKEVEIKPKEILAAIEHSS